MATILAVYSSDGCVGRCDANCYCASEDTCTCICGGKNHKVGFLKAMQNTRELVLGGEDDLAAFAAARGLDPDDLFVEKKV